MSQTTPHSLLERLQANDALAWQEFVGIYTPFLRLWIRQRLGFSRQDADLDDLVQDVLGVVHRKVPAFEHKGQPGSFRSWLKAIVRNCASDFLGKRNPLATGDSDFAKKLHELEDPQSDLHRAWEHEHDAHVRHRLLHLAREHFAGKTWTMFERTALGGEEPTEVAVALQTTVNAVWLARSKVLRWLRKKAQGLVD